MVRKRQVRPANSMTKFRKPTCRPIYRRKIINKLFAGLGSVRIEKNCDLGLENAALGLGPWAAFSRPRSQFFTIRTSQPANKIYIFRDFNPGLIFFYSQFSCDVIIFQK